MNADSVIDRVQAAIIGLAVSIAVLRAAGVPISSLKAVG